MNLPINTYASFHSTEGSTYGSTQSLNSFQESQRSGGFVRAYRTQVLSSQASIFRLEADSIITSSELTRDPSIT